MREEVLLIGDMKVFEHPVVMKCYGLSTCIGLFVKDRLTGITGGAHIFLPGYNPTDSLAQGMAAGDCVDKLLALMKNKGASTETLRAKIIGGANPLMHFHEVGSRNIKEVVDAMVRNKVYIAAMDVGGTVSRSAKFNTASEQLTVRQLEWNRTKIF